MRFDSLIVLLIVLAGCSCNKEAAMHSGSGNETHGAQPEGLEPGWDLEDPYLEGRDIDWLIANLDDFDLCNVVFKRIGRQYGHRVYVPQYKEEERVVMLAWHVWGIVCNGGFEYLFEGDIPGDPGYRLSLEAFEAIGCEEQVAAFREALALFPDGHVPDDVELRAAVYREAPEATRERINERFWGPPGTIGDSEVGHRLAEYIRAHKDVFRNL